MDLPNLDLVVRDLILDFILEFLANNCEAIWTLHYEQKPQGLNFTEKLIVVDSFYAISLP